MAREAIRYSKGPKLVKIKGEENEQQIHSAWCWISNSSLEFSIGNSNRHDIAAIVSGNTVVLKPSSDSPTIAVKFVELMEEIKLPKGVSEFCYGRRFRDR